MKKISEETKNNYFCVILDLFARKAVGKKNQHEKQHTADQKHIKNRV